MTDRRADLGSTPAGGSRHRQRLRRRRGRCRVTIVNVPSISGPRRLWCPEPTATLAPSSRPATRPLISSGNDASTDASRTIALGITVVLVSFVISLKVMDCRAERHLAEAAARQLPPLPTAPRSSTVVAQVSVALAAIRDAAERSAAEDLLAVRPTTGPADPAKCAISWTASRPIAATGAQDVLTLTTLINGVRSPARCPRGIGAVTDALAACSA